MNIRIHCIKLYFSLLVVSICMSLSHFVMGVMKQSTCFIYCFTFIYFQTAFETAVYKSPGQLLFIIRHAPQATPSAASVITSKNKINFKFAGQSSRTQSKMVSLLSTPTHTVVFVIITEELTSPSEVGTI